MDGLAFLPVGDVKEEVAYLKDKVPTFGFPSLDYFDTTFMYLRSK